MIIKQPVIICILRLSNHNRRVCRSIKVKISIFREKKERNNSFNLTVCILRRIANTGTTLFFLQMKISYLRHHHMNLSLLYCIVARVYVLLSVHLLKQFDWIGKIMSLCGFFLDTLN